MRGNHKHGQGRSGQRTPAYNSWIQMMRRCYKPSSNMYHQYGAKGIKVCQRWHDFKNFYADMGDRPEGMSLDRIDNSLGYEPDNCRWANPRQQAINRSLTRFYTFQGETLCATDWAKRYGMNYQTLINRLNKGMDIEIALTKPLRVWPNCKQKT